MMRLVFHGGKCCAIKHIYDLGNNPKDILYAMDAVGNKRNNDKNGQHVNSDLDFFTDAAPQETYVKRLDRLIKFCEKHRPGGIIEICLSEYDSSGSMSYWNQMKWAPYLRRRKFKRVNTVRNSNSGNTVHVFHRNSEWSPSL